MTSLYPHLFKAFYDWLIENDINLKILVDTSNPQVVVPSSYIVDNHIVLSVYHLYISKLEIGKESISFYTRFKGKSEYIVVPYDAMVDFIFSENNMAIPIQGMINMFKANLLMEGFIDEDEDEDELDGEETPNKAKSAISFSLEDSADESSESDEPKVTEEEEKSENPSETPEKITPKKPSKPDFTFVE